MRAVHQGEASKPNTSFIRKPDATSFVVALPAGVAGLLPLTSAKTGAPVGVAVSVTTVPAAANAAAAVVCGDVAQGRGSAVQPLLNTAGIVVAGVATLPVQNVAWKAVRARG